MARPGKYLFKRPNSQNWHLRLRVPEHSVKRLGRTVREFSLGTPDRHEAEVKALPWIRWHKILLMAGRREPGNGAGIVTGPEYEPGKLHRLPDGRTVQATATQLTFYDAEGNELETRPNGMAADITLNITEDEWRAFNPYSKKPKKPEGDDSFIRLWLEQNNLNQHIANEAHSTWALFREHVTTKPLKECTREDGRKLAALLFDKGNKSATVEKKIGHLRAAANLLVDDGVLTLNPFRKVVPKKDDETRRLPLDDADMALVRENAHKLRAEDWLLWRLLATTGMRLDEAFQIDREFAENGIRYVIIGSKNDNSVRRMPLPECLLPELPERIEGPLFKEGSETVGKRLRYFLRGLGISYDSVKKTGNPAKVIHSLRHRAADRIRVMDDWNEQVLKIILGHEATITDGYGIGGPVARLKRYIDRMGF